MARRAGSALVVGALGVLIALPLLEVAARVLHLAPEIRFIDVTNDESTVYRRSGNPVLAFELKPDWRDPDADLRRSYPSTNSHGQRDVERSVIRPAGVESRILVLGASVVEGVGIRELDDTIPRRLEARLGPGFEVLNFGVSAYCTRAKVELLRVKGLPFRPDVVVLVVTRNDFRNFNYSAFRLGAEPRPAAVEALYRGSHGFRALAVRLDWFGYRGDVDPEGWNRAAIGENNVVDGLRLFAELAREHGFDPVVAIWPRFDDERIEDPAPVPGREAVSVFEALAEANGLPFLRFSPGFRRELAASAPEESPRLRYTIGDRIHPNPFGADLAAAILAEELPRVRRPVGPARAPDPAIVALARELGGQLAAATEAPDARRWVNTGNELLKGGRTQEAIGAYRQAIASDPALAEAHHNLGVALRREGLLDEAVLAFLESVRLDPELAAGHRNIGVTLLRMGRPEDAVRPLVRAVELRPGDALAREALHEARQEAAGN